MYTNSMPITEPREVCYSQVLLPGVCTLSDTGHPLSTFDTVCGCDVQYYKPVFLADVYNLGVQICTHVCSVRACKVRVAAVLLENWYIPCRYALYEHQMVTLCQG